MGWYRKFKDGWMGEEERNEGKKDNQNQVLWKVIWNLLVCKPIQYTSWWERHWIIFECLDNADLESQGLPNPSVSYGKFLYKLVREGLETPKTIQVIVALLVCPPVLVEDSLVAKYRKMKLKSSWTLPPYWLAFTAQEGSIQDAGGEITLTVLLSSET